MTHGFASGSVGADARYCGTVEGIDASLGLNGRSETMTALALSAESQVRYEPSHNYGHNYADTIMGTPDTIMGTHNYGDTLFNSHS